jgi:hypothetical protein
MPGDYYYLYKRKLQLVVYIYWWSELPAVRVLVVCRGIDGHGGGVADPDAEVIALSPKTLLATNRFVCEICNKGFQRDQNLQLHRWGHNLPWKLRQEARRAAGGCTCARSPSACTTTPRARSATSRGSRSTSAASTARRSGSATGAPRSTPCSRTGRRTARPAARGSTAATAARSSHGNGSSGPPPTAAPALQKQQPPPPVPHHADHMGHILYLWWK